MNTAAITRPATIRTQTEEDENTFDQVGSLYKSSSRSRTSRSTTSCTQCIRRKQKCNQDQPCSNCKKQISRPLCEYGPRNKRNKEISGLPVGQFLTFSVEIENPVPDTKPEQSAAAVSRQVTPVTRAEDSLANGGSTWQAISEFQTVRSFPSPKHQQDTNLVPTDRSENQTHITSTTVLPKADSSKTTGWAEICPTKNIYLNLELSKIIYRFKGCFQGPPDPDNPFVMHFLPWSSESPLVSLIAKYVGAKVLGQTGAVEMEFALNLKGQVIQGLNHKLTTETKPSLETLAGVSVFIVVEFFFGEMESLKTHLMGFRLIVQLLGGLPQHGVGALMARAAVVNDRIVALACETTPVLQRELDFDFEYQDQSSGVFQINFNTPILVSPYSFVLSAGALSLQHTTASILDDLRFIIDKVLSLEHNKSIQKVQQIQSLASVIYQSICGLPTNLSDASTIDSDLASGRTENHYMPLSLIIDPMSCSPRWSRSPDPHSPPIPTGGCSTPTTNSSPDCSSRGLVTPNERPPPELMYSLVRAAALIYARAIAMQQPLSIACSEADALAVLTAAWRIPLSYWRAAVGIFVFAFEAILPTMHRAEDPTLAPHASFVNGIVQAGHMQMSIEDWCMGCEAAQRSLRLCQWLREGAGSVETDMRHGSPSESGIATLGVAHL